VSKTNSARPPNTRKCAWIARIAVVSIIVAGTATASIGDLDLSFNGTGVVDLGFQSAADPSSLLVSPDGKITVTFRGDGGGSTFRVIRLTANGARDTSFGGTGTVLTAVMGWSGASSQAAFLQNDDNLVVAGIVFNSNVNVTTTAIALVRYRPDGSLDPTFNQGVPVITSLNGCCFVHSVNEQPDGKILVAAHLFSPSGNAKGVVLRYNADGGLDLGFGLSGIATVPTDPLSTGMLPISTAFGTGGSIILVGTMNAGMAVARLHADGSLDTAYGAGGLVIVSFDGPASATDVVALADGGVLVGGIVLDGLSFSNKRYQLGLLRLRSDGSLETAFGSVGKTLYTFGDYAQVVRFDPWPNPGASVLIEPDGKFLVVGQALYGNLMHTIAIRYNNDGSLDSTFGQAGQIFGASGYYHGHAAAVTADKKLTIAAGSVQSNLGFVVERHLLSGDATTTSLMSSLDPLPAGQAVTFSATVAGGVTGGTVAFLDAGTAIAGCDAAIPIVTGGVGIATCTTTALTVGVHEITARYSGDATRPASGSARLMQIVSALGKDTAIEYYHVGFNHYFMTSIPGEVALLDAGAYNGWSRTGQLLPLYPLNTPATVPMCRFFSGAAFAPQSSHFYTPFDFECAFVKKSPQWIFEGNVMAVQLPDQAGACPGTTSPLYRLYNNGQGGAPAHRYTTSRTIRDSMLPLGWIAEGAGIGVTACLPN
jgi:uncharacterized delta-60 repeat protein